MAFTTTTGNSFVKNKLNTRNSANDNWLSPHITETSEQSDGDSAYFTSEDTNLRVYRFLTLPTTEKFYIITGLEAGNNPSFSREMILGVDLVNANPPTINSTPLVALSNVITTPASSGVTRASVVASRVIRGGSVLGYWVNAPVGSPNVSTQNRYKKILAYSATPNFSDNTTISNEAGGRLPAIKIYYRGYS